MKNFNKRHSFFLAVLSALNKSTKKRHHLPHICEYFADEVPTNAINHAKLSTYERKYKITLNIFSILDDYVYPIYNTFEMNNSICDNHTHINLLFVPCKDQKNQLASETLILDGFFFNINDLSKLTSDQFPGNKKRLFCKR